MPGAKRVSKVQEARSYVFYGRSGTGKTTLASTFPGDIILLDIRDRGTDSIADVDGVEVVTIEDFDDLEERIWWLMKNPDVYKTVVIDTASQAQEMLIEEIGSASKNKKFGKRPGDWGSMTKQDWGKVSSRMKKMIIDFRDLTDLGMNVVFIAQDRVFNFGDDDNDDNELAPEVGPALQPGTARVLNAAVSFIGNTFIRTKVVVKKDEKGKKIKKEKAEYALRIGPSTQYATKVRKPRNIEVPAYIVDPDYDDILGIIKGAK
jgi:hypothetical protein